jgi:hypothetical protein
MPSVHYGGRALGRVTFTADGRLPRCVGGCRLGFVDDSPLEQRGFELLVPRVAEERWRTDKLRSRVMAVVGAGPPMSAPFTVGLVVESPLLQQRVSCELAPGSGAPS